MEKPSGEQGNWIRLMMDYGMLAFPQPILDPDVGRIRGYELGRAQRYLKITNKAASHDGLIVKAGYKATALSPCGESGHQPIGADRHDPGP
jgi:hypothetical protein